MLQLKEVRKSFGKRIVLDNLDLQIEQGEIYGLLGPNGAGKTTAINLICNLLSPDSGFISFNHFPIERIDKRWIGIAPQENLLYKSLSCQENLSFFAQIYGLNKKQRRERIESSLAAVKLSERANSPIDTLSGGMQRRMNIATAIVHQPKLLILDEPTTGLDIETRYEIWTLIQNLSQQGMTILLTTHLLDEAQHLCQRIGIIKGGRIITEGSLSQLRELIPAKEIIVIETEEEEKAIAIGHSLGFTSKYYGQNLAFWLPRQFELKEIIHCFQGINISSISRQSVQLEHIYLEVMNLG
ncbi:MAG: Vitamin B12 import ATP-binding protein BtuD [Chroococcopsis gigantea SAG 12.99]|jgi:ABC-2 type transport system ATP-binding protein|nr:ABC transporter ATP-binding protein [Chlorogloea purpurea SAG 13.99]MDV3000297.1 Vitamin B12 import ATP-binding protein BtuD [Chroococcopsis gigantea SAG 12.99]